MIEAIGTSLKTRKRVGYGVLINDGNMKTIWAVPAHDISRNRLDLIAIKHIFLACDTSVDLKIITTNRYVHDMMMKNEEEEWVFSPKINADLVESIREMLSMFNSVIIELNKEPVQLEAIKEASDAWR